MKFNYRDFVILGALLAIAILIAGFFLLIKPKNEEIKTNKESLAALEQEQSEVDGKLAEIDPLKSKITDTYNDTLSKSEPFVEINSILNARQVDQYMQHFAEENEVKIMTLTANDLAEGTLEYYYFTPTFLAEDQLAQADLNGDQQANISDLKAESDALSARTPESVLAAQYSIQVQAEDKENIWNYMQALEEQSETIIINSVNLTNVEIKETKTNTSSRNNNDENKELPTAQFVITLYSVYDLAQPNLEQ